MNSISRDNMNIHNRTTRIGTSQFYSGSYEKELQDKQINRVINIIREYANKISPGLYATLELICKNASGKDCVELFLENPNRLRDILLKHGDPYLVRFIVKHILLKPILLSIGLEELENKLYDLFANNPLEFKSKIKELLQHEGSLHK